MKSLLDRFKPAASRGTRLLLAALMWSVVGAGLAGAGLQWVVQSGAPSRPVVIAIALALGAAKGRYVLADLARRNADRIVVHFRETEHGRSAVYDDGHLLEYAVFDDSELEVARANDYQVLVDDGTLQMRMSAMAALTIREHAETDPDGSDRFGNFVAQMVIGLTRYGRGEALSANHLIRGWAVRSLLSVLVLAADAEQGDMLDNLDPHRRAA